MKIDELIQVDDRKDDPTADGGDPYQDPRPSAMLAYVVDAENFHILATKGGFLNYAAGEYGYLINPTTLENEHPVCLPPKWDQDPGFYYFWDFTISGGRAASWAYEEEAEEHTAVAGKFREADAGDFLEMDVPLPLSGTAKPVVQIYVVATDTYPEVALEVIDGGSLHPRAEPYQLYLHPQAPAPGPGAEPNTNSTEKCNCERYGEGNPHWPCEKHPDKKGPTDAELLGFILQDECQVVEYENKLGPSKWRVHWPHLGEGQKELYGTAREALVQAYKDFRNKE